MTARIAIRLLASLALVACAGAPKPPDRKPLVRRLDGLEFGADVVDKTVVLLMKEARVPGLALAIINDGEIVHLKGYGFRDVARRLPMTEDTVLVGASFTKSAFAFAVMQLVDEGAFALDRPIVEHFATPLVELAGYRDLAGDARLARITPRMLLSHTSGFPNWRRYNDDGKLDIKAEPGSRYMYSGEGIVLLQRAVEQTIGRSTTELMRERVFAPFGMTRTSMVWQPELEAEAAIGYDRDGKPLGHARRESPDAAGSMDTTVRDWATFLCAVLRGDRLSRRAREEMLRPQIRIRSKHQFPTTDTDTTTENDAIRLSYGLGWGLLWSAQHGRAYFKEGHDDGFQSYSITFERPRIAIVIMTNSDNGESIFKALLETLLADIYTPWRWERYVPHDAATTVTRGGRFAGTGAGADRRRGGGGR
jgi:CubicO group peptidase (beta-lactamase class C family)